MRSNPIPIFGHHNVLQGGRGSPANIAIGLAKLNASVGFIGAVSSDGIGDFVCEFMAKRDIDLSGIRHLSGEYRTSLAVCELKQAPEVVIYRNLAADLAITPADISPDYIGSARCLVVSGTALSTSPSREATLLAMETAQKHGTKVILDLDFRAYSWQDDPAIQYERAAQLSDVLIGNREEFSILTIGSDADTQSPNYVQTAEELLEDAGLEMVIVKAGSEGCDVFGRDSHGDITRLSQGVFTVEAQKPYGAGDAFAAAVIFGLLNSYSLHDALTMGAANAAINVMGTTCSEDMASLQEIMNFISLHSDSVTNGEYLERTQHHG
ncbi:PfkB family carbohydrate kinase [Veronia nyctiphanis]|uniref:PfkB family carbohydrate kinase n=1 Tax=Veronia nyctiphanis TaxID=1278244 RepID=UPI001F40DA39|nr:PfkB family carbohydrate kinase [Veronia nyctiphanis]